MAGLKRSVLDGEVFSNAGMADLGTCAEQLLESDGLSELFVTLFDERYRLNTGMSCVTVDEPGICPGAHLDYHAEDCSVAMIEHIDVRNWLDTGPKFRPERRVHAGNEASTLAAPRQVIPTTTSVLVVGRGSEIWHERPPRRDGERVVSVTFCFRS